MTPNRNINYPIGRLANLFAQIPALAEARTSIFPQRDCNSPCEDVVLASKNRSDQGAG